MFDVTQTSELIALLDGVFDESSAARVRRPRRNGRLDVVAVPVHQGRTQQLWQVDIRRPEDDRLVARGQVGLQNI